MDRELRGGESSLEKKRERTGHDTELERLLLENQFEQAENLLRRVEQFNIPQHSLERALRKSLMRVHDDSGKSHTNRLFRISEKLGTLFHEEGLREIAQDAFNERLHANDHRNGMQVLGMLRYLTDLKCRIAINAEQLQSLLMQALRDGYPAREVVDTVLKHQSPPEEEVKKIAYIEELADKHYHMSMYHKPVDAGEIDYQNAAQQALDITLERGKINVAGYLIEGNRRKQWDPEKLEINPASVQTGYSKMMRDGRFFKSQDMREFATEHHVPLEIRKEDLDAGCRAALGPHRLHRDYKNQAEFIVELAGDLKIELDLKSIAQEAFEKALEKDGSVDAAKQILEFCDNNNIEINERSPVEKYIQYFLDKNNIYSAVNVSAFADGEKIPFSLEGKAGPALRHALESRDIDKVAGLTGIMVLHGGGNDFAETTRDFLKEQMRGTSSEMLRFCENLLEDQDFKTLFEKADLKTLIAEAPEPRPGANADEQRRAGWLKNAIERHYGSSRQVSRAKKRKQIE